MKRRARLTGFVAAALAALVSLSVSAQQAVVHMQAVGDGGAVSSIQFANVSGSIGSTKKPETALEKENEVLRIHRQLATEKQRELEAAILADAAVAAALKASREAAAAYYAKLAANAEYQELKAEQVRLQGERQALFTATRQADREERARMWREYQNTLTEIRAEIADFPEQVPELATLRAAKVSTALAFYELYQQKLKAAPGWSQTVDDLRELDDWSNDLMQQMQAQRTRPAAPK